MQDAHSFKCHLFTEFTYLLYELIYLPTCSNQCGMAENICKYQPKKLCYKKERNKTVIAVYSTAKIDRETTGYECYVNLCPNKLGYGTGIIVDAPALELTARYTWLVKFQIVLDHVQCDHSKYIALNLFKVVCKGVANSCHLLNTLLAFFSETRNVLIGVYHRPNNIGKRNINVRMHKLMYFFPHN